MQVQHLEIVYHKASQESCDYVGFHQKRVVTERQGPRVRGKTPVNIGDSRKSARQILPSLELERDKYDPLLQLLISMCNQKYKNRAVIVSYRRRSGRKQYQQLLDFLTSNRVNPFIISCGEKYASKQLN